MAAGLLLPGGCRQSRFDTVLRGGMVYDGRGGTPYEADVALDGDSIAAIGPAIRGRGRREIDVHGLAVAPGFVNMLSWATESLIEDGRSQSDIRQGVTLEVFGEGWSMGPLTDTMKKITVFEQSDIKYPVTWTTLNEYLNTLVTKGVSPNVASFIGATTVRIHELGWDDRQPTTKELERMQALVRNAMEEGALGVGSSLIYAPAFYAKTDELVALAKAAAPYGGMYISHIRSEGNRLLESVDELLTIAREAGIPAEIYHLKAAGQGNWPKMDRLISKVDSARRTGLRITADMYTYPAGRTGLDASMPPWVQEGGYLAWADRLRDPKIRTRVKREMMTPTNDWENYLLASGSPERVLLVSFKADSLKYLTGKTLGEVARLRGKSPEETAMDLVIQDGSRVGTVYFLMSEENIRKQMVRSWVSLGSDEGSYAPEGAFLKSNPHPRAYGTFARFLGKYVREDKVIPLQEAIRRLTWLPMSNLRIQRRGRLNTGFFADVVVFDPAAITDSATFDKPHKYASGVVHVFVNGTQVLADGKHTGAKPGRVLRGPGWKGGGRARRRRGVSLPRSRGGAMTGRLVMVTEGSIEALRHTLQQRCRGSKDEIAMRITRELPNPPYDLSQSHLLGVEHRSTARSRKATGNEIHDVDIARPRGDPFVEDPRALGHQGVDQAVNDFAVLDPARGDPISVRYEVMRSSTAAEGIWTARDHRSRRLWRLSKLAAGAGESDIGPLSITRTPETTERGPRGRAARAP